MIFGSFSSPMDSPFGSLSVSTELQVLAKQLAGYTVQNVAVRKTLFISSAPWLTR
jgi:hypothetical protein